MVSSLVGIWMGETMDRTLEYGTMKVTLRDGEGDRFKLRDCAREFTLRDSTVSFTVRGGTITGCIGVFNIICGNGRIGRSGCRVLL